MLLAPIKSLFYIQNFPSDIYIFAICQYISACHLLDLIYITNTQKIVHEEYQDNCTYFNMNICMLILISRAVETITPITL